MNPNHPPQPKKQIVAAPAPPFWLVRVVLGLVLVVAGFLKMYQLGFEAGDDGVPTLLLMVLSEAELLGGVWMLSGFEPGWTRLWAMAAFGGFAVASLFQIMGGKCSCGCFGELAVHPWLAFLFDLAALGALAWSRPPGKANPFPWSEPARLAGLGAIALAIAAVGWRQGDLVTLAGTALADEHPLQDAVLTFTGTSGKITLRTDQNGAFKLPFVRPGLYAATWEGRPVRPSPRPEPARSKSAAKSARSQTNRPPPPNGDAVHWIQIPECSEYDRVVKF